MTDLNEDILESSEAKKAEDEGLIRIEDETEPSAGDNAEQTNSANRRIRPLIRCALFYIAY